MPRTRPALSRQRILDTAIDLADREGLDAVTLRRLASDLGVHVTSLYNHVATREDVTDGIVESLLDGADLPVGTLTWEEWIRRFAAAVRLVARRHPGAFAALYRRPARGSAMRQTGEAALAAFRRGGFTLLEAGHAMRSTSRAILGMAMNDAVRPSLAETREPLGGDSVGDFPLLSQLMTLRTRSDSWSFFLDTLVAGLQGRASTHHRTPQRKRTT